MNWLEEIVEYFHYAIGLTGGFLSYWLGGYDQALEILLAMVVVDYLTGLLSAYVLQEIDSAIGKKGVAQKIGMFLTVAVDSSCSSFSRPDIRQWRYD
ncbi:phage holin family protein [Halanaerocella petrolearia]